MTDRHPPGGQLSLAHRSQRAADAISAMAALEPVQIAFGLRHLRRELDKEIGVAKGDALIDLVKAYVMVSEPMLRICQVPTAPKGSLPPNGAKARPILPMES